VSLQTTLAADAHPAEGQFLKKQALNTSYTEKELEDQQFPKHEDRI
jgi:hypothetical protein